MGTEPTKSIRNVAIIAHVDHGKTTLVDQLFHHSGVFRDNQQMTERLMDSMDLERERGITIAAKNGAYEYQGVRVNIIDTPGHADFGGQVERVLQMADGALLLVDAQEGPMPQTYFVLKKALALGLKIIVVVNKIDKPAARCHWVTDQVFDLFVKLQAPDHLLDFPIVYCCAKAGWATHDPAIVTSTMTPLFDAINAHIPPPSGLVDGPFQMRISSISYSPFLGRLGIGKITSGQVKMNQSVVMMSETMAPVQARITKIYTFQGSSQVEVNGAVCGEIVAIAGLENVLVGKTLTDPLNPIPLPEPTVDPPTISMNFVANDSPFAGQDGEYVTGRQLRDRLMRETLSDVALVVEDLADAAGYKVSGRGELHLSILIEKIRREGYEFQVTRPTVIVREENGVKQEPYETLTIDVDEGVMGSVIENLGARRGRLDEMNQENGMARLVYTIPTRGLLGFRGDFLTQTRGMGIMNYVFHGYGPYAGEIRNRKRGVLIVKENGESVAAALFNLQDRGRLFIGPGVLLYGGQIIGENSREDDMVVNPSKGKKLTNMRASGSDEAVILTPPTRLSLEQTIAFINDDELVEVTPKAIRIRKVHLNENDRKRYS